RHSERVRLILQIRGGLDIGPGENDAELPRLRSSLVEARVDRRQEGGPGLSERLHRGGRLLRRGWELADCLGYIPERLVGRLRLELRRREPQTLEHGVALDEGLLHLVRGR